MVTKPTASSNPTVSAKPQQALAALSNTAGDLLHAWNWWLKQQWNGIQVEKLASAQVKTLVALGYLKLGQRKQIQPKKLRAQFCRLQKST